MDYQINVFEGALHVHTSRAEPVDDRAAAYLRKLPKLGTLFATEQCLTDALATALREVPIRGLVVDKFGLTDQGIDVLKSLPALTELSNWSGGVTDLDLQRISQLENLTKLWVQKSDVTDDGLASVGKMKRLTNVSFFKCPKITDKGVEHLAGLTDLEYLFLDNDDGLTTHALSQLRPLTKLTRLEIDAIQVIDNDHLACLADFKSLECLSVDSSRLDDTGAAHLAAVASLSALTISGTLITDAGLDRFVNLQRLESLGLGRTAISDAGLAKLRPLTRLKSLGLGETAISDGGMSVLEAFSNLTQLDLSNTPVTDEGIKHIAGLRQLEMVELEKTQITDEGLNYLTGLSKLQFLNLGGTAVTPEGAGKLKAAIPDVNILGVGQITMPAVVNPEVDAAIAAVTQLGAVVERDETKVGRPVRLVRFSKLAKDEDLKLLGAFKELEMLQLGRSEITDAGIVSIRDLVNLRLLDLSNTRITDYGVGQLTSLKHLRMLDLSGTRVSDASTGHLTALQKLDQLNLSNTEVTDAGMMALGELPSLRSLYLFGTLVTAPAVEVLQQELPRCRIGHSTRSVLPRVPKT